MTLQETGIPRTTEGNEGKLSAQDFADTLLHDTSFPTTHRSMNCNGGSNSSGADLTYVNTFAIVSNELTCAVNDGAARSLVAGISALSAQYGVDPDATGSVSQYLNPGQMTTALWQSVRSVRVTLTFLNPLAGQPGQLPIEFSRVINVQSRT